jgi:hypothetical protein
MSKPFRWASLLVLTGAVVAVAAPAPSDTVETIKKREGFIPYRKYQSMPGKVIGVLVSDVRAMMGQEGRGGPADAFGFSSGGGSYRWVYTPVKEKPLITNFQVKAGPKGDTIQTYPSLSLANPETVKQWGVPGGNVLVEVEVNGGAGAPAEEGFVATNMKVLDDSKEYPLKVAKVLADLNKRYQAWRKEHQKELDTALSDSQTKALKKDEKATGPRETQELVYVTWMPKEERLVVRFRTTITDGAYMYTEGGVRPGPFPLPPPPAKGKPALQAVAYFPPPPPPRPVKVRYGTTFGIEFGMGYEVSKKGNVEKTLKLPPEAFKKELPPPPRIGPRDGPPRKG